MNDPEKWRSKLRAVLEAYLRRRSMPRCILGLLLVLTGVCGYLISFSLLHLGVNHMWMRYPVAVLGAYGLFLLLIRLWVEVERSRFDADAAALLEGSEEADDRPKSGWRSSSGDGGSWLDFLNGVDLGFDEGCLPLILIGVVVGLVIALVVTLAGAPALLAEVFLDAFVLTMLYRRLRIAANQHWLGTAIRRTWSMVVLVAALLAIAGGCLEAMAPDARSIGPALRKIFHRPER